MQRDLPSPLHTRPGPSLQPCRPFNMSPRPPSIPCVAAAIATHRRDTELARLLAALAASELPFQGGIFVGDNAAAPETEVVCTSAPAPCHWLPQPENRGPAPAWNAAASRALADPAVTHVLVLDDDVVPPPDTTTVLLAALGESQAAAAAPLLFDDHGRLWAFPEPCDVALRAAIRRVHAPEECRAALGTRPHRFCWATGACMLYSRRAFEEVGYLREDFWLLGDDLEFSMRVASLLGGVFTAGAAVPHLPPPADPATARPAHRAKFLALLQNLSYLAFHSPHRAHLRRYLPGNFKRYALTEGWAPGTLRDACGAFYLGACRGQPAGTPAGRRLIERGRERCRNR